MAIKDIHRKPFIEDNNTDQFIGIDLPIRKSEGKEGFFASTSTTIEAVKNNIRNLVQTSPGERFFQPNLGLNLRNILFNQINEEEIFLGRSVARQQNMSEEMTRKVDIEVRKLIDEGYDKAKKILTEKLEDLHKLAKALLTYETLTGDEIQDLINKNKYPEIVKSFERYLKNKNDEDIIKTIKELITKMLYNDRDIVEKTKSMLEKNRKKYKRK